LFALRTLISAAVAAVPAPKTIGKSVIASTTPSVLLMAHAPIEVIDNEQNYSSLIHW
jgi:hypothetical protein